MKEKQKIHEKETYCVRLISTVVRPIGRLFRFVFVLFFLERMRIPLHSLTLSCCAVEDAQRYEISSGIAEEENTCV